MKKILLFLIPVFILSFAPGFGQQDLNLALEDGDFFFQEEDYPEALFNYLKLVETAKMNDNIKYKIGFCYLQIPGEEYKAIPYLEEAARNTTVKYKARSSAETKAPLHAHFYLAKSYHINNDLDKALEAYNYFKGLPEFEANYNLAIVNNEITACEKAKIIQDIPLEVKIRNIGEPVNTARNNYNPVITADESFIVYMSELTFYNGVFTSRKVEGKWTEPENITPQIGSDGDVVPSSISSDGKEIYLVKGEKNNRDIYVSRLVDGLWTGMEPLNSNINSSRAEAHACISPDGKTLYFSSNRRGSLGELDIWKSVRSSAGDWGPAVNLGPKINTGFDEDTPALSEDGNILYFSSKGHYNMGNYDIFSAGKLGEDDWTTPVNIGYPINTTGDDMFYSPVGNSGYLARIRPEGAGGMDIYRYEIVPKEETRITPTEGKIDVEGMQVVANEDFTITITDKFTGSVIAVIRYNKATKEFSYITNSGNYSFTIEKK